MAAIRCEAEADFAEIHRLVKEAFATAEVSDGEEQNFVKILRSGSRYLPEFALVAQEKERLIGHIMLTKLRFLGPEGEAKGMLLLAPLCVKQGFRNRGIGGALIQEACRRAQEAGYRAVFLLGNPNYYCRYGFCCVEKYDIRPMPEGLPLKNCMVRPLGKETLESAAGGIAFLE